MMTTAYGHFLSSEGFASAELLSQARWAEQAGLDVLAISDHHPDFYRTGVLPRLRGDT
ncbi:hypothetical protein ACFYWY_12805 [Streptomyces sp. NPDC002870]|uniref:hypothetical protein n=1 Tax=Streptomyces sp. NPDC002870 TaxID=3364666 RepID=UPI0036947471